MIATNKE